MNTLEDFLYPIGEFSKPGSIKKKVVRYLGKSIHDDFTYTEIKHIEAKAKKIKRSKHKANRQLSTQLKRNFNI